jgi:hypothetical protein
MSLDINAFNDLCAQILRYKSTDFKDLNNAAIGCLRRHHSCFGVITQFLIDQKICASDFKITNDTIGRTILYCFENIEPNRIRNSIYELLHTICSSKSNLGSFTYNASDLNKLNNLLISARVNYSDSQTFEDVDFNQHQVQQLNNIDQSSHQENNIEQSSQSTLSQLVELIKTQTLLLQNLTQLHPQSSTSQTIPNGQIPVDNNERSALSTEEARKKIKSLYERILKKKNHVLIIKFHLNNNTTPSQLFFNNFPTPFLAHDEQAVADHNRIIIETQKQLMNSILKHLDLQIKSLENNLEELKSTNMIDSSVFEDIFKQVENNLKPEFDRADEKAKRIVSKPFISKKYVPKSKENENNHRFSVNRHQHHQDQSKGHVSRSISKKSDSRTSSILRSNGRYSRSRSSLRSSSRNSSRTRSYLHNVNNIRSRSHSNNRVTFINENRPSFNYDSNRRNQNARISKNNISSFNFNQQRRFNNRGHYFNIRSQYFNNRDQYFNNRGQYFNNHNQYFNNRDQYFNNNNNNNNLRNFNQSSNYSTNIVPNQNFRRPQYQQSKG